MTTRSVEKRKMPTNESAKTPLSRKLQICLLEKSDKFRPPYAGPNSPQVILCHCVGRLLEDDVEIFNQHLVILRIRDLVFGERIERAKCYEFTTFNDDTMWKPNVVPFKNGQHVARVFTLLRYHLAEGKYRELKEPFASELQFQQFHLNLQVIEQFGQYMGPEMNTSSTRPIVYVIFKVLAKYDRSATAGGLAKQSYVVGDLTGKMTFTTLGSDCERFALEQGKIYKCHGLQVYLLTGKGEAILQPTMYSVKQEIEQEELRVIETQETPSDIEQVSAAFTSVAFQSPFVMCPAKGCARKVPWDTQSKKRTQFLTCQSCRTGFKCSATKVKLEVSLIGKLIEVGDSGITYVNDQSLPFFIDKADILKEATGGLDMMDVEQDSDLRTKAMQSICSGVFDFQYDRFTRTIERIEKSHEHGVDSDEEDEMNAPMSYQLPGGFENPFLPSPVKSTPVAPTSQQPATITPTEPPSVESTLSTNSMESPTSEVNSDHLSVDAENQSKKKQIDLFDKNYDNDDDD